VLVTSAGDSAIRRNPGYWGLVSVVLVCSPALAYAEQGEKFSRLGFSRDVLVRVIRLAPSCDRYFACSYAAPQRTDVDACRHVGSDCYTDGFDAGNHSCQSVAMSKTADVGKSSEPTTWRFLILGRVGIRGR